MMRICALLALVLAATPVAAQRSLHWSDVRIEARLSEDGTLRVVETQAIVFTGDWNGGERRFDLRPRKVGEQGELREALDDLRSRFHRQPSLVPLQVLLPTAHEWGLCFLLDM